MKAAIVFEIDENVNLDGGSIQYIIFDNEGNKVPVKKVEGIKKLPARMSYLSCPFDLEIGRCSNKGEAFVKGFNTLLDFLYKEVKQNEISISD